MDGPGGLFCGEEKLVVMIGIERSMFYKETRTIVLEKPAVGVHK